jgi:putative membrane protein
MNEYDLAEPKRQSVLGIAVIFFKNLRTAINIFISLIAVSFGLQFSLLGLDLKDIAIVVVVIFLIISWLQYRRFFFYVVEDKFVIEKGLFSRDKVTIPFDRIQTVNITQNLVQQLLKVVAVKIDTAGSAQRELEISALERSYARELQGFLIERKREKTGDQESEGSENQLGQTDAVVSSDNDTPLVRLSLAQLLMVGITENHLRTALVVFAVLNGYFWQYEEYLLKPLEPMIEEGANYLLARWLILLPVGVLLFIAIAIAISVVQVLLKYYNLRFFVNQQGAQLTSGLLKRNEYQIPVKKIQYIKWNSNPLRKLLGIKTILIKKAASEEQGDRQGIKVPGCRQHQINEVFNQFMPERMAGGFYWLRAHKLLFIQLGIWLGVVPSLALLGLILFNVWLAVVGVLYLPLALFFIYRYYRSVNMAVNPDVVVLRKGWVYPSYLIFKLGKLQVVSFHQSFFQKRRGLATLRFHTAAGDARMLHIPEDKAKEIYNYALYKIETYHGGWM